MPRSRHHKKDSSKTERATHAEKLRYLSKRGIQVDPTNKRSVSRAYSRERDPYKGIAPDMLHKAKPTQARELREHGFRVVKNKVVIDRPRDRKRNQIKGAKVKVLRGGVVAMSKGERRDYIAGFTKKEKREFAKNPNSFITKKLAELRKQLRGLKGARHPQVRLQWGSYQATKDFAPSYFTAQYFATISPEERRKSKKEKRRPQPRADKLTGLHIVIHVPKKKGKKRATKTKGRKRK